MEKVIGNIYRNQWAVGQGGFHSGSISGLDRKFQFLWLFDCGSSSGSTHIVRELDRLASELGHTDKCEKIDIDVMYLSHLDADHFNGIKLFNKCTSRTKKQPNNIWNIKKLVIPFQEIYERIFSLARNVFNKSINHNDIDLLEAYINPEKYFRNIFGNSLELIEVQNPSSDEGEIDTFETIGDQELSESPILQLFSRNTGCVKLALGKNKESAEDFWILKPYIPKRTLQYRNDFLKELGNQWNLPSPSDSDEKLIQEVKDIVNSPEELLKKIKERDGFSKLSKAYKKTISSSAGISGKNLTSLSLYSGPPHVSNNTNIIHHHPFCIADKLCCYRKYFYCECCPHIYLHGWLSTGDGDLKNQPFQNDFLNFYKDYLCNIRYFSIPHHGSKNNWDKSLLKYFPHIKYSSNATRPITQYIFEYGSKNHHGHPDPQVEKDLKMASVHKVNEDAKSNLKITNQLYSNGFIY